MEEDRRIWVDLGSPRWTSQYICCNNDGLEKNTLIIKFIDVL